MYVHVDLAADPPSVAVHEGDDLTRLHIEAHGASDGDAGRTALGRALGDAGLGSLDGSTDADAGTDALLDVAKLRALAGHHQPADWDQGFDKMIAYARSKGWTTDDHRVRAHVEWSVAS